MHVSNHSLEKSHLIWSLLQYNSDLAATLSHRNSHGEKHENQQHEGNYHRQHNHHHHQHHTSRIAKEDRRRLMETILKPSNLFHLVDRINHPQLGLYVRALHKSFKEIAFAACLAMNDALDTHPHILVEKKISATSQQRRKKKKHKTSSLWTKHFDINQLLGRRLKKRLFGSSTTSSNSSNGNSSNSKGSDESSTASYCQVYAVGKLLQLFNLHDPSAELLRASLLMNMKKTTFITETKTKIILEDMKLAPITFKEWVRSQSLAWKKNRLHVNIGHEMNHLSFSTKSIVNDMTEAYNILMETLSAKTTGTSLKFNPHLILLQEGKRILDRFVVETELGNSLERNSEILLRHVLPRSTPVRVAREWPLMNMKSSPNRKKGLKSKKSKEDNEEDENVSADEIFSMYMLC